MKIFFAPLEGVTDVVYRRTHAACFSGVDRYYIPFVSPTHHMVFTPKERRAVSPAENAGFRAVPQILSKNAEQFLWAAQQLDELGYQEVNLNLGCPSGTVTAKGKGSGFLARLEELDRFFDEVFSKVDMPVSVKTRLGIRDAEEFEQILEVYNRYPIACVTIHARVQKEKYRGEVHMEEFRQALESSRNPVCYNGDLNTVGAVRTLEEQYPALEAVMIGRGAVADPALFRKLRGGSAATKEELRSFMQDLYRSYQEAYDGQTATAAQRMREVWFYLIHMFEDAEKLNKKLRRFRSPAEYETLEAAIFEELELRTDCQGDLV